jgi:hypothetical protein
VAALDAPAVPAAPAPDVAPAAAVVPAVAVAPAPSGIPTGEVIASLESSSLAHAHSISAASAGAQRLELLGRGFLTHATSTCTAGVRRIERPSHVRFNGATTWRCMSDSAFIPVLARQATFFCVRLQ